MRNAQILCLCQSVWIADLNIQMKKGQITTVTEEQARSSKDLMSYVRLKGVSITYKDAYLTENTREVVASKPDPVHLIKPDPLTVHMEKPMIDEDALAKKVVKILLEEQNQGQGKINDLLDKMDKLLQRPAQVVVNSGDVEQKVVQSNDDPVFIPNGIIKEDWGGDLDVGEENMSDSSVDDATAALRKMKKKKQEKK